MGGHWQPESVAYEVYFATCGTLCVFKGEVSRCSGCVEMVERYV